MSWRSHKETYGPAIADTYSHILVGMIDHGWRGTLDVDSELPDRLMPQAYLNQFSSF